jgi:hypothetical protein
VTANVRSRKALLILASSAGGLLAPAAGAIALPAGAPAGGGAPSIAQAPILGRREVLRPISGRTEVRVKGISAFTALTGVLAVADGSEVDATNGRVQVTVATPQEGQTANALVYRGRFVLHQDPAAPAETHFTLSAPLGGCGPIRRPRARRAGAAMARSHHGHQTAAQSRELWASDSGGSWGSNGRYVSTTVEGTRWLTRDECHRSVVSVAVGVVLVHDLIHNTSVTVSAGHSYSATQPYVESAALVPPLGNVYMGVSGGSPSAFQRQVGKHLAVFGNFASWGQSIEGPLAEAHANRERLFLHISTDIGYGSEAGEETSPAQIAAGDSDSYLLNLGAELTEDGQPTYIALLPEMNQANNAYSAFNANGSSRGSANSTGSYRQAWRRSVLILRGGPVASIDRRLHALGLSSARTSEATLPTPRVSFMWAPQTEGTPNIPANDAAAYYPGSAYVDIVGTDFYSAFPNFRGLADLYDAYPSKPFGFNEWGMWKNGDPSFVTQLFAFMHSHRRVGIAVYNQGLTPDGPFRLERFPAATGAIRHELHSGRFLAYAPEWMPK